jgi:predicted porin
MESLMSRMSPALFAVALLGASQPLAAADALSASYWDAAYLSSEREDGAVTEENEGFRVGASVGLAPFLNFTLDYDQRRSPDAREGFGSAGLAFHTRNPVYQFHGGVTYERIEGDDNSAPANDFTEEGYGVEVGGRYALDNVELHAAYRYLDFGTVDQTDVDFTGSRFNIGADVQLCPWWSLVADYRVREHKFSGASDPVDYTEYTVGFRRYFATETDRKQRKGGLLNLLFSGDDAAAE